MSKQTIRKAIGILLAVLFIAALSAAAVSAGTTTTKTSVAETCTSDTCGSIYASGNYGCGYDDCGCNGCGFSNFVDSFGYGDPSPYFGYGLSYWTYGDLFFNSYGFINNLIATSVIP